MAYSIAVLEKTVIGNHNMAVISAVADAASGIITFGANAVFSAVGMIVSGTSAGVRMRPGKDEANSKTTAGIGISGATSGDVFRFHVLYR